MAKKKAVKKKALKKKALPGASGKRKKKSGSSPLDAVVEDKNVSAFLVKCADEIKKAGLLENNTGSGEFSISMKLERCILFEEDALKIVLDFALAVGKVSDLKLAGMDWILDDEQCDEIQDDVLDYLRDHDFTEKLEAAGLDPDTADEISWVHVSVNGSFLHDDED